MYDIFGFQKFHVSMCARVVQVFGLRMSVYIYISTCWFVEGTKLKRKEKTELPRISSSNQKALFEALSLLSLFDNTIPSQPMSSSSISGINLFTY